MSQNKEITAVLETAWRAYCAAPTHRDCGRSKVDAAVLAALEAQKTDRIESALASAEPVAWSRTDDITDDDGCPIGTDEPRVVWGSEHPDPSETWFPLYGEPMLVTHDAQPAAKGESLGDGLRDYPYLIGLAKVLRMRGDPENANALDSVAERIRRTAPTPASVPDDGMKAAIVEARAHYSGVWPEQLTSGVMFFKGFRITQDRFNHSKANPSEPTP